MLAFRLRAHRGALGGCDPAAFRVLGLTSLRKPAISVAVGTRIAPRPPRSWRALLTHRAPLFAEIAANAARLCDVYDAFIAQVDGDALRLVAHYGPIPTTAPVGFSTGKRFTSLICRPKWTSTLRAATLSADLVSARSWFTR
jgi:hypothetical protein